MLTPEEIKDLDDASERLAAARSRSGVTPRTVVRAFSQEGALPAVTFRMWMTLESLESPFTGGGKEGERKIECLAEALGVVLGWDVMLEELMEIFEPEMCATLWKRLDTHISGAFAPMLRMQPPGTSHPPGARGDSNGIGWWASLLAGLMEAFSLSLDEALDTPIAQAFVLIAAQRHNNGWKVSGPTWADKETIDAL